MARHLASNRAMAHQIMARRRPDTGATVVGSFIDELAVNSKVDPVEYWRSLLGKSPRVLDVMNVAARAAG